MAFGWREEHRVSISVDLLNSDRNTFISLIVADTIVVWGWPGTLLRAIVFAAQTVALFISEMR